MPLTATQNHFTQLYLASFLRAPELSGLNYWVDEVEVQGKSLQAVNGIIFSLPVVTDIYAANLTDTQFVEAIYHNVFGRVSDAEGLNYWSNEIATLRSTFTAQGSSNAAFEARGQLAMNMMTAGLGTPDGTDGKAYIVNRLDVASFAVEQQLKENKEILVNDLLALFTDVDSNLATVNLGMCEINKLLDILAGETFYIANPSQLMGKVTTDFSLPGFYSNSSDRAYSLIEQADGKLVAAGSAGSLDFALARYNANGSLDTSFDDDGKVTTDIYGGSDDGRSLLQQMDGKLVVAGTAYEGSANFALVRYNSDGSLDKSFGGGLGKVTTDFAGYSDQGYDLIQQLDGKLVLVGNTDDATPGNQVAIARYNTDGTLDTSFGNGTGKITADFVAYNGSGNSSGYSLVQQADGQLVVAGSSGSYFFLARYNPDGSPDTLFGGGDGQVNTGFYTNGFHLPLIQQADGKLVVAGRSVLARYNSDGTMDTSFGNGTGKISTNFYISSLVQQADGQWVVAGSINGDLALARYHLDGSLDTNFGGGDGLVTTDFSASNDTAYKLIQQADGKLVVVGESNSDFALARYNSDGSLDASFGSGMGGLLALALTSCNNATAELHDASGLIIGSALDLVAGVTGQLELSPQSVATLATLRVSDDMGHIDESPVLLGTTGNDSLSLSASGYIYGFDGNDTLTGSDGADIFVGGDEQDILNLGSDNAVDQVVFEPKGFHDVINGLITGQDGDILNLSAFNMGEMEFNKQVLNANPATSLNISGQIIRLLDIEGGQFIASANSSQISSALNGGEYSNLDMDPNSSAWLITANFDTPGSNYLYKVQTSASDSYINSAILIGIINNVDIDNWAAGNFAF